MPLIIKKHELSLTMCLATLTWFSLVSDLNKIIKQVQNDTVPSTFTLFTKQKIIHYVEAQYQHVTIAQMLQFEMELSQIVVNF
jgi:hypothetical protein